MEELSAGSNNSIDQTMIMKGKRTKRQRPLSPVGRVTSSSSSGGGRGGGESGGSDIDGGGDHRYNFLVPSFSEIYVSTTDQEDEDMAANCLILLAQGRCGSRGGGGSRIKQQEEEEEEEEIKMENFSSRRVNEMVTTPTAAAAVKSGFYVYECKTCSRTFPSFQALGGHRASHKKPKPMAEEKKVAGTISIDQQQHGEGEAEATEESSEEEEEKGRQMMIIARAPPIANPNDHSSQSMDQILFSNKLGSHGNINHSNNNKSSKIHECSICGSEFLSGQALGGHMRRHRNPTTTKPTVDHHSAKKPSSNSSSSTTTATNNIFPLDLNLPAPPEDHDHRDLKFQYAANQQQHLVFSAPALVDCHY